MTVPVSQGASPLERRGLMLMVAVPAAAATVLILVFIAMELAGRAPLALQPGSIAEAAGLGNSAETLRRLQQGEDPTRVQVIRPEILARVLTHVTALESAVFSRRVQLVRLLDERGAIVDADVRRSLACLAQDIAVDEIVEYLAPQGPPTCVPGATRALIIARSGQVE